MILTDTLFNSLTLLVALIYLSSAGVIASSLLRKKTINNTRRLILVGAFTAIVTHLILIVHSYNVNNVLPHDFFNMLSLVFLVISSLFFLSALNKPIETLAIIVFPFAACAVLFNLGNASPAPTSAALSSALQIHIILSILSYSLLTVAAFQAVILSVQEKQLHSRHPGHFLNALPPMQLMEELLFQVIAVGVALLTLALASGFVFLDDIFAQHLVHKTALSILAWLVFSTLLWGRHYIGWRGQKAIRWTYGGYIALMFAYFGSKFVLQIILN
ncbi:MAG: ABC transporter permease [Piscirickettsiaceae bacterium]|nr:MAG: ABC transporter permease [Piscirickettsiaceae bacterium]PCI67297.1 MAG: ABC transporter permease [Piscirickettsiaceae bacterium]